MWFAGVVLVAVLLRSFVVMPFSIPSESMTPTLLVGDEILVSKFAYGFSRLDLPFYQPPFTGRIFGRLPARGDVVVFRVPGNLRLDFVKRVIGLPGDRVFIREGFLYLNGVAAVRQRLGAGDFVETLPDGAHYVIHQTRTDRLEDNTAIFDVPEGMFFVLGDNRDNSADSRIPRDQHGIGFVPVENLIGRADLRLLSFADADSSARARNWKLRWSRVLTIIQ